MHFRISCFTNQEEVQQEKEALDLMVNLKAPEVTAAIQPCISHASVMHQPCIFHFNGLWLSFHALTLVPTRPGHTTNLDALVFPSCAVFPRKTLEAHEEIRRVAQVKQMLSLPRSLPRMLLRRRPSNKHATWTKRQQRFWQTLGKNSYC